MSLPIPEDISHAEERKFPILHHIPIQVLVHDALDFKKIYHLCMVHSRDIQA